MLTVENIYQTIGEKILFNHVSCSIADQDRIGLIGVNGTGKSSFLNVVAGIDAPESGTIQHAKDYRIEYLAQEPELDPDLTVLEEIYYGDAVVMQAMRGYEQALSRLQQNPESEKAQENVLNMQQKMDECDAWEANTMAKTVLTQLGITDFSSPTDALSGGQRKRVAIAKALIQPADLLILDEPTNHLDNETVEWLETFLTGFKGALLLVTHDRYFLNRVTNRIFELDKGTLYTYDGNYELFLEKKAEREALEQRLEQRHQNTLKRELAWLRRGAKARSTKQKARIERIGEMKDKSFDTTKQDLAFQAGSTRLGKQVMELEQVAKHYGDKTVLHPFDYLVEPGERLGIIGANGSGKTSLLNMMAGKLKPDAGIIKIGETVKIGYYTQGEEELDHDKRMITYIKETADVIHTKDGDIITAEQMLERFLFPRSEQWTYIGRLSGGEKRRLYLLKVLMTEPNVLLLDEPTNDLDTETLSVLEDYLANFPGVVITVSHDRYFLDRVVDHLLVFEGDGQVSRYNGNYSAYLDEKTKRQVDQAQQVRKVTQQRQDEADAATQPKRKKMSYMEKREWETIEDDIATLEQLLETLEQQIASAGSDLEQVQSLYDEQKQTEEQLEAKMDRWAELSERAD